MEQEQLDDDSMSTNCIDRIEGEEKLLARDIKRRESAREQLGATDESPDAVTKSITELNATMAKATKIRQDEHLNGPVIFASGR